ncbi:MAG: putative dsRNA-binding protein [Roseburia sp.]|nr:putative dsRNA-binding protein [Roseburia sp.]
MSGAFERVERAIGYSFKDKGLLKRALTLSSYDNFENNESLECLGDALLTFIVAEKYYAENLSEGEITRKKQELISDAALRPVSERLGLDKALIRDKGDNVNKKAVPSAYEAVTAAIYLDGGLDKARAFALSTLTPLPNSVNYIEEVQNILQAAGETPPEYVKISAGTPQKPRHIVKVNVRGKVFSGEGASFQEAKKKAAKCAFEFLNS